MSDSDTLPGEGKHWYLVSYTAHNPFYEDTLHATQEIALDYPWHPGDLREVVTLLNGDMVKRGYEGYTKAIITSVFYMGEF